MSKFRRLVVEVTDFLDSMAPCHYSRDVREDLTAAVLLKLFERGVLKWRSL